MSHMLMTEYCSDKVKNIGHLSPMKMIMNKNENEKTDYISIVCEMNYYRNQTYQV
jgi:hypothetical protein